MTDSKAQLFAQCEMIAKQIETGEFDRFCHCGSGQFKESDDGDTICADCGAEREPASAYDWLEDALDIQYIITGKKEFLGARVCVAFGGPTIWVDTQRQCVEGNWWGDRASASYHRDELGLEEALDDLFNC